MLEHQTGSGIWILAVAAALSSPYWLALLRDEALDIGRGVASAYRKIPLRWQTAKMRWREATYDRRKARRHFLLAVIGSSCVCWVFIHRNDLPDEPRVFLYLLLVGGLMFGSLFSWFLLFAYSFEILGDVIGGWCLVRRTQIVVPVNPMNRVGVAAPLGEAGFATAAEVSRAASGDGGSGGQGYTPPKFWD